MQNLKEQGYAPCILTRGYKGNRKGPLFADPALHTTDDIGDEAIMLAFSNDVCVCADRIKGAAFIAAQNKFDVIVMDDGMQNPGCTKISPSLSLTAERAQATGAYCLQATA